MYVIKMTGARYYADHVGGCVVTKSHITRAHIFSTIGAADCTMFELKLEGKVLPYEENK